MNEGRRNLDLLLNVCVEVSVELGRCRMRVSEVLELGNGSIVELERDAGAPVDVLVNDRPIARGEIVAVGERYGVRLTEVIARRAART